MPREKTRSRARPVRGQSGHARPLAPGRQRCASGPVQPGAPAWASKARKSIAGAASSGPCGRFRRAGPFTSITAQTALPGNTAPGVARPAALRQPKSPTRAPRIADRAEEGGEDAQRKEGRKPGKDRYQILLLPLGEARVKLPSPAYEY